MTKVKAPTENIAQLASQMARNPDTLAAFEDAMNDATRKTDIGRRMAAARERAGLTQPQVAERAGIGINASAIRKYQNWEAGKHLPGHEQLERVADVIGTSYDYLVTGGEQTPPAKDILSRLDALELRLDRALELLEERAAEEAEDEAEGSEEDETRKRGPNKASNG